MPNWFWNKFSSQQYDSSTGEETVKLLTEQYSNNQFLKLNVVRRADKENGIFVQVDLRH